MSYLKNSTVMVTGGAGFIGSALVRELLNDGAKVVCYDNYLHGHPSNILGLEGPLAVVNGDILDTWRLISVMNEYAVDFVVHCAGDTFVPTAYEMPKRFFDVNLSGTYNVLMAVKTARIKRMIYLSSTEVYGNCSAEKISEDAPLNPVNTYAVSKLAADRLCASMHIEHAIPVIIPRIFNCYGPRETHPYIIPEIITQLSNGNVLELGNTQSERDLTYVHDTARALILLLTSNIPNGEVVNVGSDVSYSVEWISYTLAKIMGISSIEIKQDSRRYRRNDIRRFQCDNAKLRHYTNWEPQVPILEGLHKTVEWFNSNGSSWTWENTTQDIIKDQSGKQL